MSMSAASGYGDLWAFRWSIRCRIENGVQTSKLPYTPYTLYSIFQLHPQNMVLPVRLVKHFTAACKIRRLQSYE